MKSLAHLENMLAEEKQRQFDEACNSQTEYSNHMKITNTSKIRSLLSRIGSKKIELNINENAGKKLSLETCYSDFPDALIQRLKANSQLNLLQAKNALFDSLLSNDKCIKQFREQALAGLRADLSRQKTVAMKTKNKQFLKSIDQNKASINQILANYAYENNLLEFKDQLDLDCGLELIISDAVLVQNAMEFLHDGQVDLNLKLFAIEFLINHLTVSQISVDSYLEDGIRTLEYKTEQDLTLNIQISGPIELIHLNSGRLNIPKALLRLLKECFVQPTDRAKPSDSYIYSSYAALIEYLQMQRELVIKRMSTTHDRNSLAPIIRTLTSLNYTNNYIGHNLTCSIVVALNHEGRLDNPHLGLLVSSVSDYKVPGVLDFLLNKTDQQLQLYPDYAIWFDALISLYMKEVTLSALGLSRKIQFSAQTKQQRIKLEILSDDDFDILRKDLVGLFNELLLLRQEYQQKQHTVRYYTIDLLNLLNIVQSKILKQVDEFISISTKPNCDIESISPAVTSLAINEPLANTFLPSKDLSLIAANAEIAKPIKAKRNKQYTDESEANYSSAAAKPAKNTLHIQKLSVDQIMRNACKDRDTYDFLESIVLGTDMAQDFELFTQHKLLMNLGINVEESKSNHGHWLYKLPDGSTAWGSPYNPDNKLHAGRKGMHVRTIARIADALFNIDITSNNWEELQAKYPIDIAKAVDNSASVPNDRSTKNKLRS